MEEQKNGADSAPPVASGENYEAAPERGKPGNSWVGWIRQGLRAATLRSVQTLPEGPGAWPMLLLVAMATAISIGAGRLEVEGPASFDLRSWLLGWAPVSLLLFGIWLILNWSREKATHASPVAAWYLLFSVATVPITVIGTIVVIALRGHFPGWWEQGTWLAWTFYVLLWAWLAVAIWRIARAVTASTPAVLTLLVYAMTVQIFSGWQLQAPEWYSTESYDGDEDKFASLDLSQEVFESQQLLLKDALQAITPSTGNERQIYGVVYAPHSEDVFLRESAMVQKVLEDRFGARGHVVRLLNNVASTAELPWATPLNLERSLRALAEAMDTERDVLVVYLTSHGGADFKLAAEHWPLEVADLTADELRDMLNKVGIRHRVIAVSACYSGGWIEPLQNEDTLVMTAADKDHTSYGCGMKSDLTFFGRAVFDEQLRETKSFEAAFNAAVPVIKQREVEAKKNDGFSNPQIFIGANIRPVLDELAR